MAKYKVGDRFEFLGNKRTIEDVHEYGGQMRYWVAEEERGKVRVMDEERIDDLYTPIRAGFEVHKTYAYGANSDYTYLVTSLEEYGGEGWATVRCLRKGVPYSLEVLRADEFEHMVEV